MSTKSSLAINMPEFPLDSRNISQVPPEKRDPTVPYFHLYQEAFEKDGGIYLEMSTNDCQFEVTNNSVQIRIPTSVWNRLIKVGDR